MKVISQWIVNGPVKIDPLDGHRYTGSKRILMMVNYKGAILYMIGNDTFSEKDALILIDEATPLSFVTID